MQYVFMVTIVQDGSLDERKMISKLLEAASKNSEETAGIVVGPRSIEDGEDLEMVQTNG